MNQRPARAPSLWIAALGAGIFLLAAIYHALEVARIGLLFGPLLAFLLDGVPALLLVYGAVSLRSRDLDPHHCALVFRWCLGGAVVLVAVNGASVLVRLVEGRTIPEPGFELLLAASGGAVAGFCAGFFNARARADADRAEQATDAFALVNGVLRHDLRNDLTTIRGFADLIEREADDEVDDRLSTIRTKVDEAIERIDTTQVIAETLTGEAEREPVDLAAIAAESAEHVDDTTDAEVSTDLPPTARVLGDSGVRSVVDNLLENAVEHNDADDSRVRVAAHRGDDTVKLRVRDNGPGIPAKESVFEPSSEGRHGGGLHLVETLVETYGGEIRVEDVDPRGTEFVVALPRVEPEAGSDGSDG